ncbi:hypothetical protein [Pseudomonas viridiflava]|uniref:hypothetical protein n=1 Tax=Pseudomonas viridiflava TaxID=33069 RepID=UPI000F05DC57|nr:hypothetical protein [Pseudomonas viridiflava]
MTMIHLIQIEQDSTEVIERARLEMASGVRRIASGKDQHIEVMMFMGYCRALSHERLVSLGVLVQLEEEMDRAIEALKTQGK